MSKIVKFPDARIAGPRPHGVKIVHQKPPWTLRRVASLLLMGTVTLVRALLYWLMLWLYIPLGFVLHWAAILSMVACLAFLIFSPEKPMRVIGLGLASLSSFAFMGFYAWAMRAIKPYDGPTFFDAGCTCDDEVECAACGKVHRRIRCND